MLRNMGADYPKKAAGLSALAQCVVPEPAALASPGNLLEIKILSPHPRATESETAGGSPATCLNKVSK